MSRFSVNKTQWSHNVLSHILINQLENYKAIKNTETLVILNSKKVGTTSDTGI